MYKYVHFSYCTKDKQTKQNNRRTYSTKTEGTENRVTQRTDAGWSKMLNNMNTYLSDQADKHILKPRYWTI